MGNPLVEHVDALIEWLNGGREDGARDSAELLAQPPAEWDRWLADHPHANSFHVFELLNHEAHDLLTRDPQRAVDLTGFIVRHVDAVPLPFESVRTMLSGQAWIERNNALRQIRDLPAALEASERAIAIFSTEPVVEEALEAAKRADAMTRALQEE